MSRSTKMFLTLLAVVTLGFLISQVILGQTLLNGYNGTLNLRKIHQHTGYTAVGLSIVYLASSLWAIHRTPRRVES